MLSIGKELTTEQRLSKAVVDIMGNPKYVALAGILMIGERTVSDDIPTACTDGVNEIYGREFTDSLTDAQLRFVVLHENYHKLYRHLITWRHLYDEDPQLANIACDYVINLKIYDDNKQDNFATMPAIACFDEQYRDMDTAYVYNLLKKKYRQPPPDGQQPNSGSGNGQPTHGGA